MRKALVFSLITIVLLSCFLPVCAGASNAEGDLRYVIRNNKVTIIACDREATGTMVIPDTIEGCPVTIIGARAFATCKNLTEITIPDSVTIIENSAFNGCTGLTKLTIGKNVKYIWDTAFSVCRSLTSVTLPDSVVELGSMVFAACDNLTEITFGSGVKKIDRELFYLSPALASIAVSENNEVYSSQNGVLFNKDKTVLEMYPARKMDVSYTVPETVTTIKELAFADCAGLTKVQLPESLATMGIGAFSGCTGLVEIEIPTGISAIENSMFLGCRSLNTVTLPDSLTTIGEAAFANCTSLISINPGSSLSFVGHRAFENCISLEAIPVAEENPYFVSEEGVLFNKEKTTIVCYPAGKQGETYTVPDGVLRIDAYAFQNCQLKSISIPDSLATVEFFAFDNCQSLKDVYYRGSKAELFDTYVNLASGARWHFEDEEAADYTFLIVSIISGVVLAAMLTVATIFIVRKVKRHRRHSRRKHSRTH